MKTRVRSLKNIFVRKGSYKPQIELVSLFKKNTRIPGLAGKKNPLASVNLGQ
jgi:hypothetical protein